MITEMTPMDAAYLSNKITAQNKAEIMSIAGIDTPTDLAGWLINATGIKIVCLTKKKIPVLIAGLTLDRHIGQTFMIVGVAAGNRHWVEISRAIIQITDNILANNDDITRLELMCLKSNPAVDAGWYEKLGFKLESVMKNKGHNSDDCCMFVKLKES